MEFQQEDLSSTTYVYTYFNCVVLLIKLLRRIFFVVKATKYLCNNVKLCNNSGGKGKS
jgi:hypothetical protein